MAESYIISIDQSTQGTKALLFDQDGMLFQRKDLPHKQIINEKGWVSHDPEEIYRNTLEAVRNLVQESGIPAGRGVRNFKGERQRNRNQQSERNFSCLGKRDRKSNRARCCLAMCKGR